MSSRLLGLERKSHTVTGNFPGNPGTTYTAKLRVRLLSTIKSYTGGSVVQPYVKDGGVAVDDDYDIVSLQIASPAKTYYLNSGTSGTPEGRVFLDYMLTVQAEGGTLFTVTVDSIDECTLYDVVIGDPSTEDASNDATDEEAGIFCQVDYDSSEVNTTFQETKDGGVRGFSFSAFAEELIAKTEK